MFHSLTGEGTSNSRAVQQPEDTPSASTDVSESFQAAPVDPSDTTCLIQ